MRRLHLYHYSDIPIAEVAEEMLAILSDRSRIVEKKELEGVNERWNTYLEMGFLGKKGDD